MTHQIPWGFIGFGAGEWYSQQIFLAFKELWDAKKLHPKTKFLGVARGVNLPNGRTTSREGYQNAVSHAIGQSGPEVEEFLNMFYFYRADSEDPNSWENIREFADNEMKYTANRAFVIATSPSIVPNIFAGISRFGATSFSGGESVAIIEKPHGDSANSARHLFELASSAVKKIVPVDHYQEKDAMAVFLDYRLKNRQFAGKYNSACIQRIEIIADENEGVSRNRRDTYLRTRGVGPDMLSTHLLTVALKMAQSTTSLRGDACPDSVLEEQLSLIDNLRLRNFTWGQYTGSNRFHDAQLTDFSTDPNGKTIPTFLSCEAVFEGSSPIAGVPIQIRTGKGLERKHTAIVLHYNPLDGSGRPSTITFFLHKRTRNAVELVSAENVDIPVMEYELDRFSRPWANIMYSTLFGNRANYFEPPVHVKFWEAVSPYLERYEVAAAEDVARPLEERRVLLPYDFGSAGPQASSLARC